MLCDRCSQFVPVLRAVMASSTCAQVSSPYLIWDLSLSCPLCSSIIQQSRCCSVMDRRRRCLWWRRARTQKKGYRKYSNLEKFIPSLNLKMGLYESNQRGIACSFGSQSVWKGFKQVSWPRLFCLQGILQAGVTRNIVIYMIFCNTEAFPEYSNSCLGQIGLIYLFF